MVGKLPLCWGSRQSQKFVWLTCLLCQTFTSEPPLNRKSVGDGFKAFFILVNGSIVIFLAYRQRVPAIVVPLVVGIVLFAVMFTVIKCTKITRLTVSDRRDQGNTIQTEQGDSLQVPILCEPDDDDEEMIDFTGGNNAVSGMSETA